jgi:hypothetical protein
MIIVYRATDRAFFAYGFAKNERETVEPDELEDLRRIAARLFAVGEAELVDMLDQEERQEIAS